ncbi:MAG: hypothetical protein O2887_03475 [Bacteroidetes bacterium]|nr:hypothetical protein [Bacteroidota bacterium]MDA1119546.1 hypothetical protein [Bacteroidota bacterium]
MPNTRTYSEREVAIALTALNRNANNVKKTAEETKIPRKTLEHWRDTYQTIDNGHQAGVAILRQKNERTQAELDKDYLYQAHSARVVLVTQLITKAGESNNVRDIGYALKVIDDSITQFGENNTYNPAFNQMMDSFHQYTATPVKRVDEET